MDRVTVVDHRSARAGVVAAVEAAAGAGATCYRVDGAHREADETMTDLMRGAAMGGGYDFLVPLDADEFLVARVRRGDGSWGFDASPAAIRAAFDDVRVAARGRKLRIPLVGAACGGDTAGGLARNPRFRAPKFVLEAASLRDEAPEGLYVLNYMYNLHWHAPLRASQPEGFWEKQKIAFPGGDDFIDRDSGSHRGRVAADGAGLEDAANSPDAFDASNLVADGLAILHFELPPFADWRSEMVTRAADQRREARLATDHLANDGENGHWLANADAVESGDDAARARYAALCDGVGGPGAVDVAFAGLRDRLADIEAAEGAPR